MIPADHKLVTVDVILTLLVPAETARQLVSGNMDAYATLHATLLNVPNVVASCELDTETARIENVPGNMFGDPNLADAMRLD